MPRTSEIVAAYDRWAAVYDVDPNRTRDLAGTALRAAAVEPTDRRVLELGCGTRRNTAWLAERSEHLAPVFAEAAGVLVPGGDVFLCELLLEGRCHCGWIAFQVEGDVGKVMECRHVIRHHFCPTCGCAAFSLGTDAKGNEMAAANARCLPGVDLARLEVGRFDGRSL